MDQVISYCMSFSINIHFILARACLSENTSEQDGAELCQAQAQA